MKHTPEEIREMEHMHIKMSYNQIEELIYAGNNMCCQGHFEAELLDKGITADISLEAERLDNPQGVKYFFWFPWKEDIAPAMELINTALDALDNLIKHNIKTYIHCRNGHGRTSTFLAAYFIRKNGVSVDTALSMVKEKRPSAHLNEIQKQFLIEFEKRGRIL
ncbi:MAG TPA: dual specificity protein phosphatase family protein [Candidatus Omnitrophota bacterium]|nr:dual specificity protein phosphatase family protein [Candidatus Omnitrophota bacterium]